MEVKQQALLKFHGVDFQQVNFLAMGVVPPENKHIDMSITPSVYFPDYSESFFHVLFNVSLSSDKFFNLNIAAIGKFEIIGVPTDDIKNNFIHVSSAPIMFPYVRAFISTLTANLGKVPGTLSIPPHIFSGQLEIIEKKSNN
ncbi:MAG: protein-export chaperone SecB [Saprospiraceae bacterium]|nr:protein-export chaperone SecB [Candidatus Defluviibacterium haderslevense]MBK7244476.1 protein-export chaperone SecB [Candidatus Defluviibacterium haderslevense]